MNVLWSLISFFVVISVLVFVHEFGHFWAARRCGIKVLRFSLGFGKVLLRRKDKQGTEFVVSLIPLGGYVRMLDSSAEPVPAYLSQYDYKQKSVLQRAFVIAAGPLANFLFAIFAYWVIFMVGIPSVKPVIGQVAPHSIAANAALPHDWQIHAIDGQKVHDWNEINMLLTAKLGKSEVKLSVAPVGSEQLRDRTLNLRQWHYDPQKEAAFTSLGITPVHNEVQLIVSKVIENSPAQRAGLHIGDEILSINGAELDWQGVVNAIEQNLNRTLAVQVRRNGSVLQLDITPELNSQNKPYIGFAPTVKPLPAQYRSELKYGMLDALLHAAEKTWQLSAVTVKLVGKLITGDISLKNIGGPIAIAQGAGISSEIGLLYYLSFMALISVNLGIMNLIPLPVLDGGHLLFLAVEGLRGRPVSERVRELFFRIGATALLMLTVFAVFNDIIRFM
ncbi:sigma E protease regulator RseP [Spirabiliibacterium falconis]|uniref:sigma E protease regulator RseP n=1 Tax=Spirabiliibacterium falconis TaxID=572023 RepID=UPI001AAD6BCD|nr:sigma E protease regulator RseP [Spirabiliibacterium falconis]MBE2895024.1 sigma E protease regulator RseP [Spirabiliibacterium falconis]